MARRGNNEGSIYLLSRSKETANGDAERKSGRLFDSPEGWALDGPSLP